MLLVQPISLDSPVRLPGDQVVLHDGSIQLGRYGRVMVAGKTIEQIEGEINALIRFHLETSPPTRDRLDSDSVGSPRETGATNFVSVRLISRDSKVFYVLGEVNAPGVFPLRGRETVLDAILAAGGLNSHAAPQNIILTRPTAPQSCRIVLPVDYPSIVQLGDTTTNYQIRPGDRIFVPARCLKDELASWWYKDKLPSWFGVQKACPPQLFDPAPLSAPVAPLPVAPGGSVQMGKPSHVPNASSGQISSTTATPGPVPESIPFMPPPPPLPMAPDLPTISSSPSKPGISLLDHSKQPSATETQRPSLFPDTTPVPEPTKPLIPLVRGASGPATAERGPVMLGKPIRQPAVQHTGWRAVPPR